MFLVVSTVITFALLLFLSYENMKVQWREDTLENVRGVSACLCDDVMAITLGDDVAIDPSNTDLESDSYRLTEVVRSRISYDSISDKASVYIIDEEGNILLSSINSEYDYLMLEASSSSSYSRIQNETLYEDIVDSLSESGEYINIDTSSSNVIVLSAEKLPGTNCFCLVSSSVQLDTSRKEFLNTFLFPTIIALFVAVALFIGFVWLSIAPVRNMSKTIQRVSEGDYTARVDSRYTSETANANLTVSLDLTAMAQTVNSMIDILDNQEKDRNVFISSIAHDIRTPLTSINGFISAMLDGTIPEDKHEKYLILIKQEVDRIRALVVSMTEAASLSHIDPEMMEKFSLREALNDIVQNLEPQLSSKDIKLKVFFKDEGPNEIYGESQQICRVVVNIITNAIKFTPKGGVIRVSAAPQPEENNMLVTVEDSGPGVPPEKRNRVFESFYKLDASRRQDGFGLGLYICKQILVGHKQTIYLDQSEVLGGAMFVFTLPLPPESTENIEE